MKKQELYDLSYMLLGMCAGFAMWFVMILNGIVLEQMTVLYLAIAAAASSIISMFVYEIVSRIQKRNKRNEAPTRAHFISYSELINK